MKTLKYFIGATCLLIATTAGLRGQVNQPDWPNFTKYATANKAVLASGQQVVAVFMGNSITEMWASGNPDFFSHNNYLGRGIGGQTTPQFLLRFRADVLSLKPRVVVINGGINDIAENTGPYSEVYTFSNIQSMAQLAKANGIKVILTSVLPAASIPWRNDIQAVPDKVESLNQKIESFAKQEGIVYVDYYSQMVDSKRALKRDYTTDEVHVTTEGYIVMEAMIKRAIENIK